VGWGFLSRPTFMGAFRERSILKYEECHEDGCEIFRNGFHSTQVRQGLWITSIINFSVESLPSRLGMVAAGWMVWENAQQFLFFFSGVQVGEWVVEENGESEDSSDTSTIASADGEQSSLADMMAAVKVLLEGLGEDVTRDGLLKTPLRVAQAFQGATGGTYSLFPLLLKGSTSSCVQSKGLVWGWEASLFRIFIPTKESLLGRVHFLFWSIFGM
jgi:hypothetical protein